MKTKIIILAICAALVIGGCGAAVHFLRKPATAEPTTANTERQVEIPSDNYNYDDYTDPTSEPDSTVEAEPATDAQGNAVTRVTQAISRVINNATRAANKTTAKNSTTAKKTTSETESKDTKMDVQGLIGEDAKQSFLGYRYSSDGYYYCDDKDNWQKDTGYNEVYDKLAPYAAMYIDQVRIRFQYGGKNWMIQLWKGQYGYLLIGAEIGVYTCDLDQYNGGTGNINHFNAADKPDWLKMQLDCYFCKGGNGTYKKVFTRPYDTYWWATGFVKGQVTKYTAPRTEIKTKNRITFKSPEQANLFVQGLKLGGFRRAAGADQLVDDSYFMSGSDVWVLWSTIYQDSFVGYEGRD